MLKGTEKIWDILGEILAVVLILVYALLIINASYPFNPEGIITDILEIIRTYGALLLVAIVGFEAMSKRNIIFRIIFLALLAVIVVFMFFRGTYENFINIIK